VTKYSNAAWAQMAPILQKRALDLKAVAPKVLEAFKKVGKPIPAATAKVFANAGHPLVNKNEDEPKETDSVYSVNDLKYIDQELTDQAREINVDFIETGWRQEFSVTPKHPVYGSCRC
jgi:hypothetical protein